MQREDQWNEWKNSGCPEIKKPAGSTVNGTANGKVEVMATFEVFLSPSCMLKFAFKFYNYLIIFLIIIF